MTSIRELHELEECKTHSLLDLFKDDGQFQPVSGNDFNVYAMEWKTSRYLCLCRCVSVEWTLDRDTVHSGKYIRYFQQQKRNIRLKFIGHLESVNVDDFLLLLHMQSSLPWCLCVSSSVFLLVVPCAFCPAEVSAIKVFLRVCVRECFVISNPC